jgi:hypothetical protein
LYNRILVLPTALPVILFAEFSPLPNLSEEIFVDSAKNISSHRGSTTVVTGWPLESILAGVRKKTHKEEDDDRHNHRWDVKRNESPFKKEFP